MQNNSLVNPFNKVMMLSPINFKKPAIWFGVLLFLINSILLPDAAFSQDLTCPDSMAVYLHFDEEDGEYIEDQLGRHFVSASNEPKSVLGILGNAKEFNGTNQYVNLGDHNDFDFADDGSFSIELWAKFTNVSGSNKVMVGRDSQTNDVHWWFGVDAASGHARSTVRDIFGYTVNIEGTRALNDDQWHHMVLVRDTIGKLTIYVDGTEEVSDTFDYVYSFFASTTVDIGYLAFEGRKNFFYDGLLDEVAIYKRALTLTEIQEHYTGVQSGIDYCQKFTASAPIISSTASDSVLVGSLYTYPISATGRPAPVFNLSGAPVGMSINDTTGLLSWTPQISGSYSFLVIASNEAGADTLNYALVVEEPVVISCPDSMSLYFDFDKGSGELVEDQSGLHAGIAFNEPQWVEGAVGYAMEFDGSNNFVLLPKHADFDFAEDESFSVELWAKFNNTGGRNKVMVGRDQADGNLHWWLGVDGKSGHARSTVRDNSGNSVDLEGTSVLNDGRWHYMILVHDSQLDKLSIFIDGEEEVSSAFKAGGDIAGNATIDIGCLVFEGTPDFYYDGLLDELAFHHCALTVSKIQIKYATIRENIKEPTSVNRTFHEAEESRIICYPNPVKNKLFLEFEEAAYGELSLVDLSGKIVLNSRISGKRIVELDIAELHEGIYTVIFIDKDGVFRSSVIKK